MFGKARQEDGSPFSPPTIKQHLAAIKMVLIWMRLESVTIQKRPYSARRAAAPHSSPTALRKRAAPGGCLSHCAAPCKSGGITRAYLQSQLPRHWNHRLFGKCGLIPAERILTLVVSTLAEIEKAVPLLEIADLSNLERFVRAVRLRRTHPARPSAFDLPPLSLGAVRKPLVVEDDLLEEMLNDARD